MDTELFMECDEEELEPWQQVEDSVEEDDIDFMDSGCEPGEDSPLPASGTPPPTASPLLQIVCSSAKPPVPPPCPCPSFMNSSCLTPPSTPAVAPPLVAQAPPLFLTQTAGGTFLLPAPPGTHQGQPILLTTQGFPGMNRGAPLLLNLQPGQTVQPLTLIQSQSLGQLVRPSVGVSPVHQAVQARAGPAPSHVSSAAMQLPNTLTLLTGTPAPVNLLMTEVGGANCLKVAACPALPSGSANGVVRISPISSAPDPAPISSVVPARCMTPSLTSNPLRVVMSVEEFYYGTLEGDPSLRKPVGIRTSSFTCQICTHLAENNLRLMQHMLQHSELVGATSEDRRCCKFCYRQFSSPAQLQSHEEQVHGPALSSCLCRICEWAFENEPAFLNHMKSNHKPGEMPYLCQVCSYRSSFYSDLLQHFASFHRDSGFFMCLFCLKVTRNPVTYQQHLLRHKMNQAFHCNRCRLQFIFLKDKIQHKLENHRSFRRPAELEGLSPGSKVTIRTYGKIRPLTLACGRLLQSPDSLVQPINIKSEKSPLQMSPALRRSPPPPLTQRQVGRRIHVNRSSGGDGDHLVCLECGTQVLDFSAHYPTHVRCLLCPYSSCCSRAYASHMIHHHVPRTKDKVLPLHRLPPPCVYLLCCSQCDFSPQTADQMAKHLLRNPLHHSATCRPRSAIEPDIQYRPPADGEEPVPSADLPDPSWRSAGRWKRPSESDESAAVVPFQQSAGPYHFLSKNTDAIDFFHLLFPQELTELIAKETNAHAKTCRFMGLGCLDWVPTTVHEVKGFLGLVILMGIHNLPDPSHYWSWSHYDNSYTFCRAMSFRRFQQIAANIRMGSFATEELRGTGDPSDPLHVFRPMLRLLGAAMWGAYEPNCCLSVDRALLPGPDEAGPRTRPQAWLLCDSKSGYCHRLFVQAGERGGGEEGPAQGFTVVPELVGELEGKHHQLYLASSLASVPLMRKLLDVGIYASSSFPPLSPVLPRELWEEGRLERPGDFLQRRFGPLLATRWRDTKEMGCLSTNAAAGEQDTVWRRSQTRVGGLDPVDRPMAFCLLQENMRGVDICKQLLACNPLGGILQDRHWRRLFWFLVNLSVVNSFIVLRESRKENPPAWVQDGLFTQVSFRKRLGNQLAKCAQNRSEAAAIAGSRPTTRPEAPVEQRHRMGKISSISKRCKTCRLKNLRHESVYGCVVCRANLCKQPSCFWEFHGLSPRNKGSTRVGFIKDRISGEVTVSEVEDNVDGAMAPVEDLDFSDNGDIENEDADDVKEELVGEVKPPTPRPPAAAKDDLLTARKLRVALSALCDGLGQASRVFLTEPRLIRSWLREAGRRQRSAGQEQPKSNAGGADRMVAWVLSMREQQLPISESNFFRKASVLKKKGGFSDAFRISYNWAVGFMLRHRLGLRRAGSPAAPAPLLPPSLEAKVDSFRGFTQKVVRAGGLADGAVAAMDELCLFVDLRLVQDKSRRSEALELTGSLPLVTVYLAALADGTMLPSVVLANRRMAEKVLPEFILTGPGGLPVEEALDLWTNEVWLKHVSRPARPRKSMLVLDRHREHTGDPFLAIIGGAGTLPAVIPGGCSSRLQPLEVCARPVLQRFLLARWAKFTAGNPEELEETAPHQLQANVAQLLVDWLVEALGHLNQLPWLWEKSFRLTGLLPKEGCEVEGTMSPEEVQADLLKRLTEVLLGPEASGDNHPELLEPEDDEAGDEDQGREKDAIRGEEEKKETGEDVKKEAEKPEGDSEERGEETANDTKEASRKRRETRIVIGEEVGDEWKITGKSRVEES
ncbi:uncharacterized protein pogzb isoform X1 [Pungitius pungitius]|uniref:uncharacterized protein pogzb isoform X1 n=1 Tax=Pungitius pungitius TaxID=134920 RepID=UPI002E1610DF